MIYSEIQELQTGRSQGTVRTVRLDRLLIPLSGRYAKSRTDETYVTVFYGVGGYDSGPYTNSGEFQERIHALLGSMGYRLK